MNLWYCLRAVLAALLLPVLAPFACAEEPADEPANKDFEALIAKSIPEKLRATYESVLDEKNAYTKWTIAAHLAVAPPEKQKALLDEIGKVDPAPIKAALAGAEWERCLADNDSALKEFGRGAALGQFQLPPQPDLDPRTIKLSVSFKWGDTSDGREQIKDLSVEKFRDMARVLALRSLARQKAGAWSESLHDCALLFRVEKCLGAPNSNGGLLYFALGEECRSYALAGLQGLADESACPVAVLERALELLGEQTTMVEHRRRALVADFHFTFLWRLRQGLAGNYDMYNNLKVVCEQTKKALKAAGGAEEKMAELEAVEFLDIPAMLEFAGAYYVRAFDFAGMPWADVNLDIWKELKPHHRRFRDEVMPPILRLLELTEGERRKSIRSGASGVGPESLKNFVGMGYCLIHIPNLDNALRIVFQDRAELEATRLLLALQVYKRKHGQWPKELKALVGEKVLSKLPHDPYTGADFGYSAESGKLWSAGEDAKDEGGKCDEKPLRYQNPDMVWFFESAKAPAP